jgi:hypothetical protein
MDENLKTFVCTQDEETRNKLLEEGLVEVKNSNGVYTFLVNGKQNFSVDANKIKYTNKLCI